MGIFTLEPEIAVWDLVAFFGHKNSNMLICRRRKRERGKKESDVQIAQYCLTQTVKKRERHRKKDFAH